MSLVINRKKNYKFLATRVLENTKVMLISGITFLKYKEFGVFFGYLLAKFSHCCFL